MFRKEAEGADVCIRRMNSQEGLTSKNILAQLRYQCPRSLFLERREQLGTKLILALTEVRKFGI